MRKFFCLILEINPYDFSLYTLMYDANFFFYSTTTEYLKCLEKLLLQTNRLTTLPKTIGWVD